MTKITRFDTHSTSGAPNYKHRNSTIRKPAPRNRRITTFIYFQIRGNSKHINLIIFLRSSDVNLTPYPSEWDSCSFHCSLNSAILHYQLTDKTAHKEAYDATSASETYCANLFEELEIPFLKFIWLKCILRTILTCKKFVRLSFLICKKKFISSKEAFMEGKIEKNLYYFFSVQWYRELHTESGIFRIVAFCLLFQSSLSHTKMISNLLKVSIKSMVKFRYKSG